jgi:predicted O-methyltransferase YrrM
VNKISRITKRLKSFLSDSEAALDAKDALAMAQLAPLDNGYLPWSGSSIRPSALVSILNDIVINRRSFIVECGSGISTLYIGRLLQQKGGHLVTIDHDAHWSVLLRDILKEEGLENTVTVIHAPMCDSAHSLEGNQWYDETAISSVLNGQVIDLLLVDGPLAYKPEIRLARYPAVPFFASQLSENATIVLDDIHRKGEREIVKRWNREFGFTFEVRRRNGGIAIGTRNKKFQI